MFDDPAADPRSLHHDDFEAEILPGLAPWARPELDGIGARIVAVDDDAIRFRIDARHAPRLDALRRVSAVYRRLHFEVPRPRALLGDRHLRRLLAAVREATARGDFAGFRFSAAGSDSAVFGRLADAIANGSGLARRAGDGELLLRVRPTTGPEGGWEVLVRRTPRPLSARAWRACNLPGGLNACVAAAMIDASDPAPGDRFLNAMCGSGTLLVERALHGGARPARLTGFDLDWDALECARANLEAASLTAVGDPVGERSLAGAGSRAASEGGPLRVELRLADAGSSGLEPASFDVIATDPPWGDAVGDHERNAALYPRFLDEAARLLAPGGRLLLLSHEVRLVEGLLAGLPEWRVTLEQRVFHGGHRPLLLRLERGA